MAGINSYRDLLVWQKAMDLAERIYSLTRNFPKEEMYGLVSQLRRASVSIPSNLAENSRRSTQEYIRFINIASGSLAELETQLMLSQRLKYITQLQLDEMHGVCVEISKMLFALQRALSEKNAA